LLQVVAVVDGCLLVVAVLEDIEQQLDIQCLVVPLLQ
jgi:hypothetical protein